MCQKLWKPDNMTRTVPLAFSCQYGILWWLEIDATGVSWFPVQLLWFYLRRRTVHLRQFIRKAKNWVYPGSASQNSGHPRPLGTHPRQLSGHIVAQEVARHRDTPNFCVRVISDIYRTVTFWSSALKKVLPLNCLYTEKITFWFMYFYLLDDMYK